MPVGKHALHRRRRALLAALASAGVAGAASLGMVAVTAQRSAAATGPVTITIPGWFVPQGVAVDPRTDRAYVAGAGNRAGSVAVINMATGTLVTQINAGAWDNAIAVDVATDTIYVSSSNTGSVLVIDGVTNTVTRTLSIKPAEAPGWSSTLAQDPDTGKVYLAANTRTGSNTFTGDIEVIDEASGSVTPLAGQPCPNWVDAVAVNPATGTLYADCGGSDGLALVSIATGAVEKRIPATDGHLAVDPDTNVLYTMGNGIVTAYNARTGAVLRTVSTGLRAATSIAVDQRTGTAFEAPSNYHQGIALVNGTGKAGSGTIPEANPGWLAVDSATGTVVYASVPTSGTSGSMVSLIPPPVAPRITSAASVTSSAGRSVNFRFKATGTPASTFTESGKLPAGVFLTRDGTLSGGPAARAGGTYKITITAANGVPPAASRAFTLVVDQQASFTSASHVTFKDGRKSAFTIRTAGYPVARITRTGALPAGLRLTIGKNGTAVLSGTPVRTARGKTWVLRLTAANHVGKAATQRFTLRIS